MNAERLSGSDIQERLHALNHRLAEPWSLDGDALAKTFVFADFRAAFAFMTRVALEAEKMDHHPRWTNVYNRVEIWLNTHDAGDTVTEKDHSLARRIDKLIA